MAASHSVCASMKRKVLSTTAFALTCRGSTASKRALSIQRITNERQNNSSITGTSSAAPTQRAAMRGHSSSPLPPTGMNFATGAPQRIHGASSVIHSANTATPTPTASSSSRASGASCRDSSPYSRRQRHISAPTASTVSA